MTVVEAMAATSMATSTSSVPNTDVNPVVLKTSQEILTSLHLIKDIRRLEKYQRDFFLKVKESLNHVQVLLDHQLMDMAWSDNLTDCEENLLKLATHLQTTSSSQLAELYGILIHDREKLSSRFQELSVKSSLSEYVVNSRALLDLHGVQIAAEAILNNEKPLPARGDHSIPVDHTFFLANFCTASLASSMMATFMPKNASSSPVNYSHQQQQQQRSAYDSKKLNGNLQQQQQQHQVNGIESANEHLRSAVKNNGNRSEYVNNANVVLPPASSPRVAATSNISLQKVYDDKYLEGGASSQNPDKSDLSNGLYAHEFVSAISQITTSHHSSSAVNNSVASIAGGKTRGDPWGEKVDESLASFKEERFGRVNSGSGNVASTRYATTTSVASNISLVAPAQDISHIQNDASSDDMSSTSEDVPDVSSPVTSERGKPLSFARIASLNLEKQQAKSKSQQLHQQVQQHHQQQNSNSLPTLQAAIDRSLMSATPPTHADITTPIMSLPPSTNPRYFFDIVMDGRRLGRVVIEVEASVAPKMASNFHMLVTGERGFGYRGCQFFQVWKNESVICGDWEHNSGRGGRAAIEEGSLFTPDETRLPCIRGAVGMRRMSKKHSTLNEVASQFRIILGNMSNQFTGIFGHIVSNIEVIDRVANFGGEGGRPEKMAIVANCGIYKS